MQRTVDVVRGRKTIPIEATVLQAAAAAAAYVVVDVGTGDGRWVYRTARAHASWLCVGIDANGEAMRETSHRAACKPARGGVPNAWFVRAPAETLPGWFQGIADEIRVAYPWSGLLRAVIEPVPAILAGIAGLGRPGARVHITVNVSALDSHGGDGVGTRAGPADAVKTRLAAAYAGAGIALTSVLWDPSGPGTTWARRLGGARPAPVLVLAGFVHAAHTPEEATRSQDM